MFVDKILTNIVGLQTGLESRIVIKLTAETRAECSSWHEAIQLKAELPWPSRDDRVSALLRLGLIKKRSTVEAMSDEELLVVLKEYQARGKHSAAEKLQKVFQTWNEKIPFDTVGLRDKRLRSLYKDRYDFRRNIIDWDYQEIVKPLSSIIHIKQYREWRQSGIAYEFGDQTYNKPNRTMSSYAEGKERGLSHLRRGFWDVARTGDADLRRLRGHL